MKALEVAQKLRDNGWCGFRGECFSFAATVFEHASDATAIVMAINRAAWEKEGRMIGHACVLTTEGFYVDGDCVEKQWQDIEHWGMLDINDLEYSFLKNDEEAEDVLRLDFKLADELKNMMDKFFPWQEWRYMNQSLTSFTPAIENH